VKNEELPQWAGQFADSDGNATCGKNFDFSNETIIREYTAVRKNA